MKTLNKLICVLILISARTSYAQDTIVNLDGTIIAVEIIDYKTDVGATANDLLEKHREQLLHYRALTAKALGVSKNMVKCYAIGLHQGVYALIE